MSLDDATCAQLAWHVNLAVGYELAGDGALARTELLLAWAILAAEGVHSSDVATVFDTADESTSVTAPDRRATAALRDARDSADALRGHFTSEQRFDLVGLYERVADLLNELIERGGGSR